MKKQFVTYEIALKLKELGFDEECLAYFNNDKYRDLICTCENGMDGDFTVHHYSGDVNAPLWQQVIDWFIENYNIYIWEQPINSFIEDEEELNSCIFIYQRGITDSPNEYDDKEQAILKAIELCKKKKT